MKAAECSTEELENAILDLPKSERSRIAKRIISSLDDDADSAISDAWKEEIGKRVHAMNNGISGVSHEEATQRARAAVARARSR